MAGEAEGTDGADGTDGSQGSQGTDAGGTVEGGAHGMGVGGGDASGGGNASEGAGVAGSDGAAPGNGDPGGPPSGSPNQSETVVDNAFDPQVSDTVTQTGLPGLLNDAKNLLQSKLTEFQNDPFGVLVDHAINLAFGMIPGLGQVNTGIAAAHALGMLDGVPTAGQLGKAGLGALGKGANDGPASPNGERGGAGDLGQGTAQSNSGDPIADMLNLVIRQTGGNQSSSDASGASTPHAVGANDLYNVISNPFYIGT